MSIDPAQNILDQLIERHAPEEKIFRYQLSKDQVLEFDILSDMVRYNELYSAGGKWVKNMLELHEQKKLSKEWASIFHPDAKLLAEVFLLCALARDPQVQDKFKMFRVARSASPVFLHMYQSVTMAAVKSWADLEAEEIEEAGKD
jgi:hypothetical protein